MFFFFQVSSKIFSSHRNVVKRKFLSFSGRFTVGQNVAAVWTYEHDEGNTPDFPTQIEAWFNEVNQHGFPKGNLDPFRFSKPTGHYTQVSFFLFLSKALFHYMVWKKYC